MNNTINPQNPTPRDIFEHKRNWNPHGYKVDVHSDLVLKCKSWCRENLKKWEWSMDTYTDLYSHSFYFENMNHAHSFRSRFEQWVDKGKG